MANVRVGAPTLGVAAADAPAAAQHESFRALTLGAIGVVFGDIGTSPIYSMREALAHAGGASEAAVLGIVSLVFWALVLIVTVKYLVLVMRADNAGEGGTLSLMALAQHALGRRSTFIFVLGICGAGLFYGDGLITPAISVLSAAEGLTSAPGGAVFAPYVLPAAAGILVGLFAVQSRGTATVGRFFGPVMLVWFVALAAMGAMQVVQAPKVLLGLSPLYGVNLIVHHGFTGFAILGSVFLVVTGAEALFADMGHFGKAPIRLAWLGLAFPCLLLNYLGQGAEVLHDPATRADPFFRMIPQALYWPILGLTTAATIIASQAVITGDYSVTQQAVQLGLLPRLIIRRTSETMAGQIYVPVTNGLLMIGVIVLLIAFRTSSAMASAYGIAVTGTMIVTVLLLFVIERRRWRWPLGLSLAVSGVFLAIDLTFFSSNTLKFAEGGWAPVALALGVMFLMWTWTRGSRLLGEKAHRDSIPLDDLVATLRARGPFRVSGTAVFLTSDPEVAPVALMHNLKHNKVLHAHNIILTVETADTPRVADDDRIRVSPISDDFMRLTLRYGFMETPNIPQAMKLARASAVKFDIMATSFFVGRRTIVTSVGERMPIWQDKLFAFMMRNAANPTDFFHIPPGRVVLMGTQVTV